MTRFLLNPNKPLLTTLPRQLRLMQALAAWWQDRKYQEFWRSNCDRQAMREIYPRLSQWLSARPSPRLLDIGCRWYSARLMQYLKVTGLDYWVVEPAGRPWALQCTHFLRESLIGMERRHPSLQGSFDCILSFGVLGFVPFDRSEAGQYLDTVRKLLKPDGRLLLKLDEVNMSQQTPQRQVTRDFVLGQFDLADDLGLEAEQVVSGQGEVYRFLILKRCFLAIPEKKEE